MSQTVKNKGLGFNLGNTFKYTVKQLKKIGNIRHILSRNNREAMLVASKTYLQPIYEFMKQKTEKWTLPSLYSFVILLLVTIIKIQYFPGIEMYKSILFVMLHRFLVNGVENLKNFQLVQNFINNSKVLSFLFGRSKKSQTSPTSSDPFFSEQIGDMKKEVSTSLASSFSTFINDFFQNTDISIVTKKLTKFVMSILILLLVFYFIEYYFPEPLKYQRVITPYISRLPSMVQEVLTRLITFLKNKIPILQNIEVNWNSGSNSSFMTSSNESFFNIFFTILSASIISNLLESALFDKQIEEFEKVVPKEVEVNDDFLNEGDE